MATAGYTPQGASVVTLCDTVVDTPVGLLITLPVRAIITSASFYARYTTTPKAANVLIYSGSAGSRGSLLHTSVSADTSSTTFTLETRNFSSQPILASGTYWLQLQIAGEGPGTGGGEGAFDTGGGTNTGYQVNDVGTVVYNTNQYSVYITYTPSGGTLTTLGVGT